MIIPPAFAITDPYRDFRNDLKLYQWTGCNPKTYGQNKRKSYKNKLKNKRRKK